MGHGVDDVPQCSPDEVVVIYAFATRYRLHARLGGLAAGSIEVNDGLR